MACSRKQKPRKIGTRRYKKIFDMICEGSKTEPEYFNWLKQQMGNNEIHLNLIRKKSGESSPTDLIKQAEKIDTRHSKGDKVWIVMDVDEWTDEHFQKISKWKEKHERNHVAVSNPKFEYWILLHGEQNLGTLTSNECSEKYNYFMSSKKGIDTTKLTVESVILAAKRAKQKYESGGNRSQHSAFLPKTCGSTLFLLIEELRDFLAP